jgi:hypothetical protein
VSVAAATLDRRWANWSSPLSQLCAGAAAPLVVCLEEINGNDWSRSYSHLGSKRPHRVAHNTENNIWSLRIRVKPILPDESRNALLRHICLQKARSKAKSTRLTW